MRLFFSIVTGYLMFLVASTLLVQFSGRDPRSGFEPGFAVLSVALGMCFAFVAGFWASKCAKRRTLTAAMWLAGVIAGFAIITLPAGLRSGTHWTQLAAPFLMAPCAVLGGWFYRSRQAP